MRSSTHLINFCMKPTPYSGVHVEYVHDTFFFGYNAYGCNLFKLPST